MPSYHICAWTTAFAFAFPTGISSNIHGYWGVSQQVDNIGICWIKVQYSAAVTQVYSFIMLYIPVLVTYVFALVTLVVAFERLRQGIPQTILHRMKAFVLNSINAITYLVYWLITGVIYSAMFGSCAPGDITVNYIAAHNMLHLLIFLIASKGLWSIIVWILTVDVSFGPTGDKGEENDAEDRLDLNSALRQEVLTFATKGIRHCASRSASIPHDQKAAVVTLTHVSAKTDMPKSGWFAFFLILGEN